MTPTPSPSPSPAGAIAGGVIGAIAALGLAAIAYRFFFRNQATTKPASDGMTLRTVETGRPPSASPPSTPKGRKAAPAPAGSV